MMSSTKTSAHIHHIFDEISALSKYAIFKPSQRLDEPEATNKCVIHKQMYHLKLNKKTGNIRLFKNKPGPSKGCQLNPKRW